MWKMAFRNIFRNRKRTALTISSVSLGVIGIVFSLGYIEGLSSFIEKEAIKQTGHIRITDKNYDVKSRVFDTSANISYGNLVKVMEEMPEIKAYENYIKFGAYAFNKTSDIKIMGLGVEENSYVKEDIKSGEFFKKGEKGKILVGNKVLEKLKLKLGDEITLVVNTQYNSTYALNYEIIGLLKGPSYEKNVIIPLLEAEYLMDMEGKSSELLLFLKDKKEVDTVKNELLNRFDNKNLVLKNYNETGLASVIPIYNAVKYILVGIIGFLSSIAIFNTMVMSVFERKREIGVIKALGMEDGDIKTLLCLEGLFIGLIGSIIGIIVGSLMVYYYQVHGIYLGGALDTLSKKIDFGDRIYTKLTLESIFMAFSAGFIVSLIASYLPAKREVKKEIVDNLNVKRT